MDNDGTPDLELYIDEATSSCPTKLQIGKEVILSEETKGYIVGYPGVVHGRNWDDARDYLWPIPAAQRTLNPALTQNPELLTQRPSGDDSPEGGNRDGFLLFRRGDLPPETGGGATKTVETAVNSLFFYYFRTTAPPDPCGVRRGEKRLSNTNA